MLNLNPACALEKKNPTDLVSAIMRQPLTLPLEQLATRRDPDTLNVVLPRIIAFDGRYLHCRG